MKSIFNNKIKFGYYLVLEITMVDINEAIS